MVEHTFHLAAYEFLATTYTKMTHALNANAFYTTFIHELDHEKIMYNKIKNGNVEYAPVVLNEVYVVQVISHKVCWPRLVIF